uniref:Uncharacterized protein n=1 Tax=Arundo donax TaxID=35708 RepID=A0A0A9B3Q3_ARUDO
MSSCLEDPL